MGDDERSLDMRRMRMARWLCMECGRQYEGPDSDETFRCTECGSELIKAYWFRLGSPHLQVVK